MMEPRGNKSVCEVFLFGNMLWILIPEALLFIRRYGAFMIFTELGLEVALMCLSILFVGRIRKFSITDKKEQCFRNN